MDLKKFINEKILHKEEYAEVFYEVKHDEPVYINFLDNKTGLIKKNVEVILLSTNISRIKKCLYDIVIKYECSINEAEYIYENKLNKEEAEAYLVFCKLEDNNRITLNENNSHIIKTYYK